MKKILKKGFTLIEMIAVIGIFGVLTSVVVFNYGKFTSDTVLTNMAYEIALSIREAQIYGVSVRNPSGAITPSSFSVPYGVHFESESSSYYLFADKNNNGIADSLNCGVPNTECVTPYKLQRNVTISNVRQVCVDDSNGLNVTFKRPNPEARFDNAVNVSSADIELMSPDGITKRYVVVRNNGQIYVTKDKPTDICS